LTSAEQQAYGKTSISATVDMAIATRKPAGVIHHSDQGCQYTSVGFGARCRDAGVRQSTGRVGDCYDNAMVESFFATLETELLDRNRFPTERSTATWGMAKTSDA
jgi:putative transposase